MKKKILVVDNNPLMLEFMTDLLRKEGHQVLTAEDGLSALDILKTYIPDVIFIDLIMPNIEGKKLCQVIRSIPKLEEVYLVILSAIAAEEEINLAKLGADAYIAKGQWNEMTKNINTTLDQLERKTSDGLPEKIVGIESVFPRDITKELLSTKRHFEIILGGMSEGILEVTSEKRIVYANPTAISLIGIPEEKLLGTKFFEMFNKPDRERIEKLLETMDTRPQTITEESPLKLNSNLILLNIIPVSGEEHNFIIILNDITERKRAEEELKKYRDHLEELVEARTADLQREIMEHKQAEEKLKEALKDKELLLQDLHHKTKSRK